MQASSWKAPRNRKNRLFKVTDPLIWSQIGWGKMYHSLRIPYLSVMTITNLAVTQAIWLKMSQVLGKVAQKGDFVLNNCTEEEVIRWKQPVLGQSGFSSIFEIQYLISFTVTIWLKTKPGHPKKGSHKLILAIFDIPEPPEVVVKAWQNLTSRFTQVL